MILFWLNISSWCNLNFELILGVKTFIIFEFYYLKYRFEYLLIL